MLRWDGEGPAVYVTTFAKPLEDGEVPPDDEKTLLEMLPPGDPYDGSEVLTFKLPKNLTWNDIRTVSIWYAVESDLVSVTRCMYDLLVGAKNMASILDRPSFLTLRTYERSVDTLILYLTQTLSTVT